MFDSYGYGHTVGTETAFVLAFKGTSIVTPTVKGAKVDSMMGLKLINLSRLYFVDYPCGCGRIQKDRDACLFASFGCSSENGSDSCKGDRRGNPNSTPKGCLLTLIALPIEG